MVSGRKAEIAQNNFCESTRWICVSCSGKFLALWFEANGVVGEIGEGHELIAFAFHGEDADGPGVAGSIALGRSGEAHGVGVVGGKDGAAMIEGGVAGGKLALGPVAADFGEGLAFLIPDALIREWGLAAGQEDG